MFGFSLGLFPTTWGSPSIHCFPHERSPSVEASASQMMANIEPWGRKIRGICCEILGNAIAKDYEI
jgi:hypothetical protein